jgi:pantothenate synthetase
MGSKFFQMEELSYRWASIMEVAVAVRFGKTRLLDNLLIE